MSDEDEMAVGIARKSGSQRRMLLDRGPVCRSFVRKTDTASSSDARRAAPSCCSSLSTARQPSQSSAKASGTTISAISVRMLTLNGTDCFAFVI